MIKDLIKHLRHIEARVDSIETWAFVVGLSVFAIGMVCVAFGVFNVVDAALGNGDLSAGFVGLTLGSSMVLLVIAPCWFLVNESRKKAEFLAHLYENRESMEGGQTTWFGGAEIGAETELRQYECCVSFLLPWPWGMILFSSYYAPGQRGRFRAALVCSIITIIYGWMGVWTVIWLIRALIVNLTGGRNLGQVSRRIGI